LKIPKTSSRAITTPSGTADAMETICKVDFNFQEIKEKLDKKDSCLVWGGKLNLAPSDDEIIEVERLLNLDPVPQLLASILAKKLSVNANYILIHIPYGRDAKVTRKEAEKLKRKFYQLARYFDLKVKCVLNKVREPYGSSVGPALEMKEAIEVLKRKDSCHNLEDISVQLAGKILEITGKSKDGKSGRDMAQELLDSGQAWEEFKEIVENQEGELKDLEPAEHKEIIKAKKSGKIKDINITKLNQIARTAGCPLDKKAGLYLHSHLNDKIKKGQKLITVYAESRPELNQAVEKYREEEPIEIR
jgi:AMP phosphorylase